MGRLGVVVYSQTSLGGQQDPAQRGVREEGSKEKRREVGDCCGIPRSNILHRDLDSESSP